MKTGFQKLHGLNFDLKNSKIKEYGIKHVYIFLSLINHLCNNLSS